MRRGELVILAALVLALTAGVLDYALTDSFWGHRWPDDPFIEMHHDSERQK